MRDVLGLETEVRWKAANTGNAYTVSRNAMLFRMRESKFSKLLKKFAKSAFAPSEPSSICSGKDTMGSGCVHCVQVQLISDIVLIWSFRKRVHRLGSPGRRANNLLQKVNMTFKGTKLDDFNLQ